MHMIRIANGIVKTNLQSSIDSEPETAYAE